MTSADDHQASEDAEQAAGWRWSWTCVPLAVVDLAMELANATAASLEKLHTELLGAHTFQRNQKVFESTVLREIEAMESASE